MISIKIRQFFGTYRKIVSYMTLFYVGFDACVFIWCFLWGISVTACVSIWLTTRQVEDLC